jgi:hypothetical protein
LATSGRGTCSGSSDMAFMRSSSAHPALHGRHLQLYAPPAAALVAQPQTNPHRFRVGDDLGHVTGHIEVIPGRSQRLVKVVDDLRGPCAESRVVVTGGARSQLQTQLHCQTALEQEDRLAILITNSVKHCGDDHRVQPPLQPRRRHGSVSSVTADESLQVAHVTRQLPDVVSHRGARGR